VIDNLRLTVVSVYRLIKRVRFYALMFITFHMLHVKRDTNRAILWSVRPLCLSVTRWYRAKTNSVKRLNPPSSSQRCMVYSLRNLVF